MANIIFIKEEIFSILNNWVDQKYSTASRMCDNSNVQKEYLEKTNSSLNKLLEYVKTNFSN